jgi:hypothetical protein
VDRWAGNVTGHGSEGGTRFAREHSEEGYRSRWVDFVSVVSFQTASQEMMKGLLPSVVRLRPTPTMRRMRSSDSVRLLLLLPRHLCVGNADLKAIRRVSRYFHFGTRDTRKSVWLLSSFILLPLDN